MDIKAFEVSGYRSVRSVRLALGRVNVVVGPNGSGKSNLYRALRLVRDGADGRLARSLAEEGGMPSVLWAGPRGKGPVRLTLAVELDGLAYELAAGLIPPTPGGSAFDLDPHVKDERLWVVDGRTRKKTELMRRENATVQARDADGTRQVIAMAFSESESALSELREPVRFPVLAAVRELFLGWRFYQGFRADAGSPLRQAQIGVRTPVLAGDGRDLAAALRTIEEVGDAPALADAVDRAFPGSRLEVDAVAGRFALALHSPGFARPFEAKELSDGTIRYLALLAALLTPRPPGLIALDEPEAGLHPGLIPPIAGLIARASATSQVWITTHSTALADEVRRLTGASPILLEKVDGATRAVGRGIAG